MILNVCARVFVLSDTQCLSTCVWNVRATVNASKKLPFRSSLIIQQNDGRKKDAPQFSTLFIHRPVSIVINVAFRVPAAVRASAITLARQRLIRGVTMKPHMLTIVTPSGVKSVQIAAFYRHIYTACIGHH